MLSQYHGPQIQLKYEAMYFTEGSIQKLYDQAVEALWGVQGAWGGKGPLF